ncbi:NAD(P)-dependent oxidoreductase [Francisella philomiragia]|uniref:NAD(P)-dependent oxidoreductase n=1 Tax=Francisella philomiragia TaxID=28110 RepID=UPI001905F980|nr:NAD(P)-dependent oxidoreductase [Francisella philomiragia]MBK2025279.1 NAD(P)-dependent oxidoreductase [Francisella philomiragia]
MVVGGGQLAKAFKHFIDNENVVIFASGVSNSNCTDTSEFEREKNLLLTTLKNSHEKTFVYFSSCALSACDYLKNDYYRHKQKMEELIKLNSNSYCIFRIPQLFGKLIPHGTLINYIYGCIKEDKQFSIYSDAYRYVIEINDVVKLVDAYLKTAIRCSTIDIANTYRYSVKEIVNTFEKLLNKKADFQKINKTDKYTLNLGAIEDFITTHEMDLNFGKDYLENKLAEKLKAL